MNAVRCFVLLVLLPLPSMAQRAALRGRVTDESGGVIPAATVVLNGPSGVKTTKTGIDGNYAFPDLPPGDYTLRASAPQLILREPATITLRTTPQTVNLVLHVLVEKQEVTVEENSKQTLSTEASANASAVVMRGSDLDALSDNPDDLAADLQALAGPAAGPNGGTIYIDGLSGGQLPPKNSIREIRINQNPFSPEYDKLGFGRI
jgi:Carboxypeptidase regulatory-like domain